MSNGKYRVRLDVLVILFFLSGIILPTLLTGNDARIFAQSENSPDLVIETISWSPEFPSIGDSVTFTVTVRNQGDSPAGSSRLAYFLDDNLLTYDWAALIHPGAIIQKSFTWKAQAGPHIIKAVIDYEKSVFEIDENNNDQTYAFSVLAPDLAVVSIAWLPKNPSAGDKVTFTVTVKNQGNKTASGSNVNLYIDGNPRGYREIRWLEAGENTSAAFTWLAISGVHTLEAFADGLSQVKESDETNNYLSVTYATAAPDLVIDSITWSPLNRSESSNVTMTVKISNRGSGKADSFWLAYYIDDSLQKSDLIGTLKAGVSITKTYWWIAGADSHTFKAVADSRGELAENDESNNAMSIYLSAIVPDLIIQSITSDPAKPIKGEQVVFNVIVKNQGLCSSGFCDLDLYINDAYILHQRVPITASGKTATLPFAWITQSDTVTLKAVVDVNDFIDETIEANNTKTVNIGFSKKTPDTDLTIESMSWTPANPSVDDMVTITISIKNKGPGQAGPSHVDYYIDDTFLASIYAEQIDAGKTITNTVTWPAEPGNHIIKAIADCNNSVGETSETNNEKTVTLSVLAPDLVIQGVTWSPVSPKIGDKVSFTVIVKNRGDRISGSSSINYYVDDSFRGNHVIEAILPGGTVTRTFSLSAQNESLVFRIIIDEADEVKESNESNNEKTIVLPAPDLTLGGIAWSPENPSENERVTFDIMIKNQGAGPANSPHITVYIDATFLATVQFSQLNPGETATGACTWTALNGEHFFKAVIDEPDIIAENDEANNEKSITLSIIQKPVAEPGQETKSAATPDSILPEMVTVNNTEIIKALLFEDVSDNQDISKNIADTSPATQPWWQKILMNKILIIGVGVLGVGAIAMLMLLRRKARKN